jgi:Flavoprotein
MSGSQLLTVVVCGAGPAPQVDRLVVLAQTRGWRVGVVATPAALPFIDRQKLEAVTGSAVRCDYQTPGDGSARSLPDAAAVVVAPATYNIICKLANGISDNYALGTLAEAIGRGLPVVVLPFVNTALAARQPFQRAVESLRAEAVRVLFGPGEWEPHPPGTGGERIADFPWAAALDAAGVVTEDAVPSTASGDPRKPPGVPTFATGTAPSSLYTDWQLGQRGLNPGGPVRGWLLLRDGGMPLYDINEAVPR